MEHRMALLQNKQSGNHFRCFVILMFPFTTGFLCGGSEGLAVAAAGSITNVTVGESVLFPVLSDGGHSYIVDLIFRSMSLFTWYPETKYCHFHNQYKDRISICDNGSICLNTVRLSDSGLYQTKIVYSSGDLKPPKHSDFHLQVFEPVSRPTITAECLGNISLRCSSSQGSKVTYSWETLPPCGNDSCVQLGQTIEINSFLRLRYHTLAQPRTLSAEPPVTL
ncbi:hypothetical protein MATL_G00242980 [Megalops atlanticus]|uniref:Uncharacterized protein n=1 Tax=Megalops atlanticus TaxID=7932 RepID=A0A9D3SVW1_MEGAT|nr:hypothetical protein MATL_G00242980 [Megalops atlanticus]